MESGGSAPAEHDCFGMIVIAWPIEVGGHQADRIKAMLLAQSFAELDAGNLGDRIPLIRGLKRPSEQRLLLDRLLGELRVDAAAAQKQQPPHPRAPGRFDHIGLDLEVLQQKISRVGVVGVDTSHFRSSQHHHRRLVFAEPLLHRQRIEQIKLLAAGFELLVVAGAIQERG